MFRVNIDLGMLYLLFDTYLLTLVRTRLVHRFSRHQKKIARYKRYD